MLFSQHFSQISDFPMNKTITVPYLTESLNLISTPNVAFIALLITIKCKSALNFIVCDNALIPEGHQ